MDFKILHRNRTRLRVHMQMRRMSCEQADILLYYLEQHRDVVSASVRERTADAIIVFRGSRSDIYDYIRDFDFDKVDVPEYVLSVSGRKSAADFRDKLVTKIGVRYLTKFFLPYPLMVGWTFVRMIPYVVKGLKSLLKGRLEVSVLDATAIAVSVIRGNYDTAGSVMFLLEVGELLEDWTHKKSIDDLARSMTLGVTKVWLHTDEGQVQVRSDTIVPGDVITIHMGNVIPFDAKVIDGDGMVNQSSLTGEPLAVHKQADGYVYAGTVLEEGELTVRVDKTGAESRYEKVIQMIEDTEKLKSTVESKAEHLADRLVPYSFLGTALTYALTRNIDRAVSVLMVDYSCALKMAMPIAVLSAIRQARDRGITVKGGKFLEAIAEADTIVFDKTGTLTKATPRVTKVVSFCDESEDELLRLAACMEEHFPHSLAKAVVEAAEEKGLLHEERHSKVSYIVAHGISTTIDGKTAIIGSYHFVFEDEGCVIPEGLQTRFDELPSEASHLYLAIDGSLAAVICIEDPLREEAADAVRALRDAGFVKIVMMTGDSEKTAAVIAEKVGVDEYHSEVLPEEKADYILRRKETGAKVIMIGDGVNDSPALSAADVGIAISDGAELAREVADVTIAADNLMELVALKNLSKSLMRRIRTNYRRIVTINSALIALGAFGVIPATTSAIVHNASTIAIGVGSMNKYED